MRSKTSIPFVIDKGVDLQQNTKPNGVVLTISILEILRDLGFFAGRRSFADGFCGKIYGHGVLVCTREGVRTVTGFFDNTSRDHRGLIRIGESPYVKILPAHHCEIHTIYPFPVFAFRKLI